MSGWIKVTLVAIFCLALFLTGYLTCAWQDAKKEVKTANGVAVAVQAEDKARADAKDTNLVSLRAAETTLKDGVHDDTAKTDELMLRILRVTDGVQSASADNTADTDNLAADLKRAEASATRLRGALRVALDGNREDARRANGVARQLNLCITQLELDRQQLVEAQRQ
jgi:hypothetical protein